MNNYDDIINLPHKQSATRPHMPIADRAAQFAPFAALTGYDEAITETGRLTDCKRELSDGELEELNARLNYINDRLTERFPVTVTYFQPDSRKPGGAYLNFTGIVKRIDNYEGTILFEDGKEIFIDDISGIDSSAFSEYERQF